MKILNDIYQINWIDVVSYTNDSIKDSKNLVPSPHQTYGRVIIEDGCHKIITTEDLVDNDTDDIIVVPSGCVTKMIKLIPKRRSNNGKTKKRKKV